MGSSERAEPSRFFAQFAAFVALAVGALVLAGWSFGMESLVNLVPTWPRMARLTALVFMFAGTALWLTSSRARLAPWVAGLVAGIGLMVLLSYAFDWDVYFEQFSIGPIPDASDGRPPVRTAPATAVAFVLFGLSLLYSRIPRGAHLHQALAILSLLIGWLALSRYLFGGEALFAYATVAVHTATLFVLLSAGALTLRPDAGIAALLASDGVGGGMARTLLPVAVIVPLFAGAITLRYERNGAFGVEAAISVFALLCVIAFVAFVWINAARGERADAMRRRAERGLRLSEERNQLIVEMALDAVVTMNNRGLVTGWNTQAEKMFGWTRAEVLGRELAELIIPERHRETHREGLRRYIENGMARVLNKRIEMSALHRDNNEFPVELAITPIGFGEDLVFSGFIRDITSRSRAEAALRESEQRFRTTANAAPVLIWMSGRDRLCTWFNQRWLDFVGRAMEQELGDGWCDNLHPADFDRTLDTYHAAFDARRPYEVEFRLQRDDGAWRWLLERGTPNFGPGGEFEGFIGTCIDITEHRETVEQLRESRARFKTLAESLPQMIWTCLRDGYTDYLSRQWLDYTGRSEAQQLGSGWLEQVHPDDRVKVQMEWARVIGTGDAYDIMYRIRRFDGVYRWFKTRAVPLRDPAGRILKWFGSNTDIEDFVVAERKLKVQLERMQLLDRTTHAIGIHQEPRKVFDVVLRSLEDNLGVDFGCLCVYQAEPELLTISAIGEKSAPRARQIGLIENTQIEVDENALGRCVHGELVYEPNITGARFPFPARLATGGLRAMVAAPLMIEEEVFGILVVAKRTADSFSSDDCEFLRQLSSHVALAANQARLYDALQSAYQDLRQTQQTVMQQERLRALGQIASGIAHDINNALGAVLPLVQQILVDVQSNRLSADVLCKDLQQIEQSLQTCRRIFGGMLALARGATQGTAQANVRRALDSSLGILKDGLERQGIQLDLQLMDIVPNIRAGQGDLEQLFGDVGLAELVVFKSQVLNELVGIVGGVFHRHHTGAVLAGFGFEQYLVNLEIQVVRQQLAEHIAGGRLEEELGRAFHQFFGSSRAVDAGGYAFDFAHRQQLERVRPLAQRGNEIREQNVNAVHIPFGEHLAGKTGDGASFAEERGILVGKFRRELAFGARDELRGFASGGDIDSCFFVEPGRLAQQVAI